MRSKFSHKCLFNTISLHCLALCRFLDISRISEIFLMFLFSWCFFLHVIFYVDGATKILSAIVVKSNSKGLVNFESKNVFLWQVIWSMVSQLFLNEFVTYNAHSRYFFWRMKIWRNEFLRSWNMNAIWKEFMSLRFRNTYFSLF